MSFLEELRTLRQESLRALEDAALQSQKQEILNLLKASVQAWTPGVQNEFKRMVQADPKKNQFSVQRTYRDPVEKPESAPHTCWPKPTSRQTPGISLFLQTSPEGQKEFLHSLATMFPWCTFTMKVKSDYLLFTWTLFL
jgi:hypothetical protein